VKATTWSEARHILCVRLDALGDVLMTSPALHALKMAGKRITLLTSKSGAAAATLMPFIDEVIVYDPPWMKSTEASGDTEKDRNFINQLKDRSFDGGIIFTVYSQNPLPAALTLYLADIPLRAAYCRENPYHLLTNWTPEKEPVDLLRHEVQRQLDLVQGLGIEVPDRRMKVSVSEEDILKLSELLGEKREGPLVVVHPGSTAQSRRYDPEKFSSVIESLASKGAQLVVTGSRGEEDIVEEVVRRSPASVIPLVNVLTLPEFAALLSIADLLISNNTGPVHLAAAVGTPVVDLYALTNPQHTPWGVPSRVLYVPTDCAFCYKSYCREGHHDCLQKIPPERVVEASWELLNGGKSGEFVEGKVVML